MHSVMHPDLSTLLDNIKRAEMQLQTVLLGKNEAIRLALTALVAQGHLLIEDRPGVGKTLLAQALGQCLGLDYKRVQFTSDLLPSDILGANIYRKATETFEFMAGPVFANVLLADEINRASSKTQSALLEAMEERSISVEVMPRPAYAIFRHCHAKSTQSNWHFCSARKPARPLFDAALNRFAQCGNRA